jgi:hypothetical protein
MRKTFAEGNAGNAKRMAQERGIADRQERRIADEPRNDLRKDI